MKKNLRFRVKLYHLVLLVFFMSPNIVLGQYQEIRECTNEQIAKSEIYDFVNVDIFDSIQKFEDYLIRTKLLKNKKRESYGHLIGKKIENEQSSKIVSEFKFLFELNENSNYVLSMYNNCPTIIGKMTDEWGSEIWPEKKVFDKIIANGTVDSEILKQASKVVKYECETSRLMFCNLLYIHWFQQYKDEIWAKKDK